MNMNLWRKKLAFNSTLCFSYSGHRIPHIFWMPFAQWAFKVTRYLGLYRFISYGTADKIISSAVGAVATWILLQKNF